MKHKTFFKTLFAASCIALLFAACGDDPKTVEPKTDAGTTIVDSGTTDAGTDSGIKTDAGLDAGTTDAGLDAGTTDAGLDAGTTDGGTTPPPGNIGKACTTNAMCGTTANDLCVDYIAGGACVKKGCSTTSPCEAGSKCVGFTDENGDPYNACVEDCSATDLCSRASAGFTCDTDNTCWNYDYVPVNPGKSATGATCTADADCAGGTCLLDADGFVGGYCSYLYCDSGAQNPCDSAGTCIDTESDSLCLKTCAQTSDCRTGYKCDSTDNVCVIDLADSLSKVGIACTTDTQCGSAGTCLNFEESFPGGYCSVLDTCSPADATSCDANSKCIVLDTIDDNGDIAAIDACAHKCTPTAAGSSASTDCRTGYHCDAYDKVCIRDYATPSSVKIGEACTTDTDCVKTGQTEPGALCLKSTFGDAMPGGYCVAPGCTPATGTVGSAGYLADTCGAGFECVMMNDPAYYQVCVKQCSVSTDCRTGYVCADNLCLPPLP